MQNSNSIRTRSKLVVLDHGACVDDGFLGHVFEYNTGRILITRDGKTVACVVKGSDPKRPDQFAAAKTVVLPFQLVQSIAPHLPLAGLVRMATEGEVALALETVFDGSKYLLLTSSAEKFDPDDENVVVLKGTDQMRIGYQLYRADLAVGQKVLGGPILDYEGFVRKQIERMCA